MSDHEAEIARLTAELAGVREALTQQTRATEAAHRKIEMREADSGAWIVFAREAAWQLEHGAKCEEIQSDIYEAYDRAIKGNAPGAALLAELDAARAVGAYLNDRRHWRLGDICPTCGFGKKLDGSEFHGTGCVLAAYNAAMKAREV